MLSKKAEVNEEFTNGQTFAARVRGRRNNLMVQQMVAQIQKDDTHGDDWTTMSDNRLEAAAAEKRGNKFRKPVPPSPQVPVYNRARPGAKIGGGVKGTAPGLLAKETKEPPSSLNKYKLQIKKYVQSIDEYKKLEESLKTHHEMLLTLRKEINELDVEAGDVPELLASFDDMVGRASGIEKMELTAILEEKTKLEESLRSLEQKLKGKEEELRKYSDGGKMCQGGGEGDMDQIMELRRLIDKLDQENIELQSKIKLADDSKYDMSTEGQKIKTLEKLIESLHIEMKKLKDTLKIEKEAKHKLEIENQNLIAKVDDLKNLNSSSNSKYIILEKDQKIQDLQTRLSEISRIRPHQSSGTLEVIKVDFTADTPSLINQLAQFIQLYEDLSRDGIDLESKLKEAHMEIYRLEQILEKQLVKIKEQDQCLKNMEKSLSKVVDSKNRMANADSVCRCDEFETILREKDEFNDKMKEKMTLLYQKYKQYKSECNIMRKKLDSYEKKSWLKKLVSL